MRCIIEKMYLSKEDLSRDTILTIQRGDKEEMGQDDEREENYVLYFQECKKGLVLKPTNIQQLHTLFGTDEMDRWVGRKICLYVDPTVQFRGKLVGGIRIRPALPDTPTPVLSVDELTTELNLARTPAAVR